MKTIQNVCRSGIGLFVALCACGPSGMNTGLDDVEFRDGGFDGTSGDGGLDSSGGTGDDGVLILTSLDGGGSGDSTGGDDDDATEARSGSPGGGGWINNGLDNPDVSGVDPNFALLSSDGLAEDSGLLSDPDKLITVEYLVECALPADTSIVKEVDGETLVFNGLLGLAPEWETEACDEDCQQWVTACLLARTNVSDETVLLWLRADHSAIGLDPQPDFSVYEASFYGNIFEDPEDMFFCKGKKNGPAIAGLEGRTCTQGNGSTCGFTKYKKCSKHDRCEMVGSPKTATNCRSGKKNDLGLSYHTISVYVDPT